jgi:holo-[acyl-carrier protein] synthase
MITGVGTDIVQVERIGKMRSATAQRFMQRLLTPAEAAYCRSHADATERIAGRFAAKEAVLKALGTGLGGGVTWRQIEILPDAKGAPRATFKGAIAKRLRALGATRCHLSISHQGGYAVAFAVIEAP